jgi:hypothetical protein
MRDREFVISNPATRARGEGVPPLCLVAVSPAPCGVQSRLFLIGIGMVVSRQGLLCCGDSLVSVCSLSR